MTSNPEILNQSATALEAGDVQPAISPGPGPQAHGTGFWRYLATKVVAALISFLITLVIGFILFSLIPSDPVATLTRGRPVTAAQLANLRSELGVDLPVWERFLHFVNQTVHLRLGFSYELNQSVSTLIGDRIGPTVLLLGVSTVISVVLGLWLGQRSGWRHGSTFDRASSGISITLWSVPTFWLGLILLVVFSGGLGAIPALFPAGGMSTPNLQGNWLDHTWDVAHHMILPVLTLVLVVFAQYMTIMRSSIIDELGSPYLLTARAKGLRDDRVRTHHAVPNALLPSVTLIFLQLGGIVGGAITVETVFNWPGLGYLTYKALQTPDIQTLQGTFVIFSATVIVMNLLADLLYRVLDPRVRAQ